MSITIVEADGQLRTITKEADFLIILEKLTIEKLKDLETTLQDQRAILFELKEASEPESANIQLKVDMTDRTLFHIRWELGRRKKLEEEKPRGCGKNQSKKIVKQK